MSEIMYYPSKIQKRRLISVFQRLPTWQLWLSTVVLSLVMTELIVVAMEWLLLGKITMDYLLTGMVTSVLVASMAAAIIHSSGEQTRRLVADLAATLQAIPDLMFELSQDGEYLNIWAQNPELLAAQKETLLGHTFKEMLPPEAAITVITALKEAEEKGYAHGHVIRLNLPHLEGWFELSTSVKAATDASSKRFIVLSRDITARKLAEQKLAASYRQLQQLSLQLDKVREEEQGRIAREIHDEMGATLTALKMRISWLTSKLPPEMAQFTAEAEHIDKLVADTIHIMRHVVSQLMPTQLHDLGFREAVERYVQGFQKHTRIECGLALPEEELTLDKNQSFAMFRILQESLNNVAKHAQATKVSILLIDRGHSLILLVEDNGVGFDRNTRKDNSFGLLGIKERALMVNGRTRISSRPGKGTQVLVSIPLAEM
jgi:signal transduction histidine kinase